MGLMVPAGAEDHPPRTGGRRHAGLAVVARKLHVEVKVVVAAQAATAIRMLSVSMRRRIDMDLPSLSCRLL